MYTVYCPEFSKFCLSSFYCSLERGEGRILAIPCFYATLGIPYTHVEAKLRQCAWWPVLGDST